MKFQPDHKPLPYLNRRDQYRLLAMVAALCFVMVAVKWAAQPSSWHWLAPPTKNDQTPPPSLEELDFRVQSSSRDPLGPDTFRSVAEPSEVGDDGRDSPSLDIPARLLSTIEDNTLGLRRKEADAYHAMLVRVDRLPEASIAGQARDDVAFTVLMQEPDEYRGQLLTIKGDLRRLTQIAASTESGFDELYEGWVFTRDSGNNPYRIVCTKPPEGVALRESLDSPVPVRVDGFFFKRYGYASQGGQHVAPMLIARTLTPLRPPAATPADGPELRNAMIGIISMVVVGIIVLGVGYFASDRRFRRSRLQQLASARLDAAPEHLATLQHAEVRDPDRLFES